MYYKHNASFLSRDGEELKCFIRVSKILKYDYVSNILINCDGYLIYFSHICLVLILIFNVIYYALYLYFITYLNN